MGNQLNQKGNEYVPFNPEVSVIKKYYDPRYGEIKLVFNKQNSLPMILKEIVVHTKEAYDKEFFFFNKRANFSHSNFVKIFGFSTQDQQNFCSASFKLSVYIEVLSKDLEAEFRERQEKKQVYSESEILFFAENLISGLSYFQTLDLAHGDIRPCNIFVSDNQIYKLSDPSLSVQRVNGLASAILGTSRPYLSPELLRQVAEQDFELKSDRFKADVYSLGATMLGLASMTRSEDIYDFDNSKLIKDLLDERLEKVKKTYSKFTYDLIADMLIEDCDQRLDFVSLANRLSPYREEIRKKIELPFFKNRHVAEENTLEKYIKINQDINKYEYEEKENPILLDFIKAQMSLAPPVKKQPTQSISSHPPPQSAQNTQRGAKISRNVPDIKPDNNPIDFVDAESDPDPDSEYRRDFEDFQERPVQKRSREPIFTSKEQPKTVIPEVEFVAFKEPTKQVREVFPQREQIQLRENVQSHYREPVQYREQIQPKEPEQYRQQPQVREQVQIREQPQYREPVQYRDQSQIREQPQVREQLQYREPVQYVEQPQYREFAQQSKQLQYREPVQAYESLPQKKVPSPKRDPSPKKEEQLVYSQVLYKEQSTPSSDVIYEAFIPSQNVSFKRAQTQEINEQLNPQLYSKYQQNPQPVQNLSHLQPIQAGNTPTQTIKNQKDSNTKPKATKLSNTQTSAFDSNTTSGASISTSVQNNENSGFGIDDLDSRIKAALLRSQQTFNTLYGDNSRQPLKPDTSMNIAKSYLIETGNDSCGYNSGNYNNQSQAFSKVQSQLPSTHVSNISDYSSPRDFVKAESTHSSGLDYNRFESGHEQHNYDARQYNGSENIQYGGASKQETPTYVAPDYNDLVKQLNLGGEFEFVIFNHNNNAPSNYSQQYVSNQ